MKFKLGDRIKAWRDELPDDERPTILEMAVMFDVSIGTLSRYMSSDVGQPRLEIVAKICEVIGVTDINDVFEFEFEEVAE